MKRTQFLKANALGYHVAGSYIPRTNQYNVAVTSTYTECSDPEYHRRLLQLTLTGEELDAYIAALIAIRKLEPVTDKV
jgi:hypothetical protein